MHLCISRNFLGTEQHLIIDESGEISWSELPPVGSLVYGDSLAPMSVESMAGLYGIEFRQQPPKKYKKSLLQLGLGNMRPPLNLTMTSSDFNRMMHQIIEDSQKFIDAAGSDDYMKHYLEGHKTFCQLSHLETDHKKIDDYLAQEDVPNLRTLLQSFRAQSISINYSRHDTTTGRLTVSSGPNVLTLPKKYRDIIRPKKNGNVIAQIDYSSLEPRIASIVSGREPAADIYEDIRIKYFDGVLDRDQTKLATLSILYGAGRQRIYELGFPDDVDHIMESVIDYFDIRSLSRNLMSIYSESGFITNYYGRKIVPTKGTINVLYNNFIQSTAVDVSLIGFNRIISKMQTIFQNFSPLFVVHDALVFEIDETTFRSIDGSSYNVDLDELGKFPVSISSF